MLLTLSLLKAPASAEPAWHRWLVTGRDLHCSQKGHQEFDDRIGFFNGEPRYRGHYSLAALELKTFVAVEASVPEASAEVSVAAEALPPLSRAGPRVPR